MCIDKHRQQAYIHPYVHACMLRMRFTFTVVEQVELSGLLPGPAQSFPRLCCSEQFSFPKKPGTRFRIVWVHGDVGFRVADSGFRVGRFRIGVSEIWVSLAFINCVAVAMTRDSVLHPASSLFCSSVSTIESFNVYV